MNSFTSPCSLRSLPGVLFLLCVTALPISAQEPSLPDYTGQTPGLVVDDETASVSAGAVAAAHDPATPEPASSANAPMVPRVRSQVEVNADRQPFQNGLSATYHFNSSEVLSSAGTWGDFTRYLQLMPGVTWNSDMSNDVMVRGGSPEENLYVVDGIEVPNINHIAVEGTTGGFTSMVDTATIGSIDFKEGAYDARYSSRLSSMVEIHTLTPQAGRRSGECKRHSRCAGLRSTQMPVFPSVGGRLAF